MSTTTPFPFVDFRPSQDAPTPTVAVSSEKLDELIAEYESALGDQDKTTDPEDSSFYAGKVEALEQALTLLLDVPRHAWETYRGV